jgi:hypothetical protein
MKIVRKRTAVFQLLFLILLLSLFSVRIAGASQPDHSEPSSHPALSLLHRPLTRQPIKPPTAIQLPIKKPTPIMGAGMQISVKCSLSGAVYRLP